MRLVAFVLTILLGTYAFASAQGIRVVADQLKVIRPQALLIPVLNLRRR
jgi:hypothetical protein